MRNMTRFSIALVVLMWVSLASAQNSNSGDIRGTVTDATGAIIQGATVTVNDVDKGVTTTYVTNSVGLYDTGSIVTDHYIVTFAKEGFSTLVRGPITLQVETLTIDGALQVGKATDTVRVTSDVPLLETETGTQSTTMPEQELQDLPNFASWENFIILAPGTAGAPSAGGANPGQATSVNGNAAFYNVLGDGVTMSLPSNGNSVDYNFDTLQEVQMVTSVPSAQYENGGAIYNQISKGGTSQFHGDLFEYFQNNDLNAASYAFGQGYVPIIHANYFGGSVGGPIPWTPLKKKLFFFFNYAYQQYYGTSSGFQTVPTTGVPTASGANSYNMLAGDFTGQPTIYDPTTQIINGAGIVERKTFAAEYGNGNKIPSSMLDSVAQAIGLYYPVPNVVNPTVADGITTNNYFYKAPSNSPNGAYFWRADYDITSNNRLTATEFYEGEHTHSLGINICPIDCYAQSESAYTGQISDVWTFSPDKINEFRFGISTQFNLYKPDTLNEGYPAKLGLLFAKANLFPEVNVAGSCCFGLAPGISSILNELVLEPSDVVTIIKGKHVLHFGGEFLNELQDTTAWGNIDAGSTTYSGVYTASTQGDTTTGLAYADFLLGQASNWSASNTPEYYPRFKTAQLFAQDDIKLRPNLTLNLGVRWEGWNGMTEKDGNMSSFDPTVINPGTNPLGVPNTLGAMWYGTTGANGRTKLIAPVWDIFLPRFGASWQLRSNTVIRGGIGLYAYNYNEGPAAYSEMGTEIASRGNEGDSTNGAHPVVILDQDGSVDDQGTAGASINSLYQNAPNGPASYNGQGVAFAYYHEPIEKIIQYNLEVQRALGPNMAVKVAYVGSHGYDQYFSVDLNQVPESKLASNDGSGVNDARPYPNFQGIGGNKFVAISNYNALQATIEKRVSSGLNFNFNYTWSKFLDEDDNCSHNCGTFTVQNMYDQRANYGPADYDIRNMFKGRIVYKLPVGKGQKFLNNSTIADAVVGGWQTSATIQWQSGNPFTVVMANSNDYALAGVQYPNVVPGVSPKSGPHGTTNEWFNVAAFTQPTAGTFGNSSRNSLYGPGLSNINFSLGKNFSIWRESKLQLRVDSSNVLNHPSFGTPDPYIGPGHNAVITGTTIGGRSAEILARLSF
jgi:hypothetical protein